MKRVLLTIAVALCAMGAWAATPDFASIGQRLREDGGSGDCGVSDGTGLWVVTLGVGATREAAALDALKEMAAFLSSQIAASAESAYAESEAGVTEAFQQMSRVDIDQLLKGVRIESTREDGEGFVSVAVLTQKTVDASNVLSRAMSEERPGTVTAVGEGETREAALEAAKRSALEQVMGTTVVASDASADGSLRSRVFADVQGAVSAYRILSEGEEDGVHRVEIVAEINKDELQESYGAQMKAIGDPIFWIDSINQDAQSQVSDFLMGKGLKTSVQKSGSDYRVELRPKFERRTHPMNRRQGTQLQLTVVCYDKGGVQLFTLQNDPRKATSFVGTEERQRQIAMTKAVKQVSKPLHERLQRAINDLTNNGRVVRMVFRNVTTQEQCDLLERLTEELNDFPGASSATYSLNEAVSVATVRLTQKGNPQDFLGLLRERVPELPSALSVDTNKIVFEF